MQQNFVSDLLKKPMWMLFLVSWLFYLIGLFLFSQLVWDANTYMLDFKGTDFDEFLSGVRRIDMLRYALSPVWIIGMSAVIWALIRMGLFITGIVFDASLLFKIIFLGLICISLSFWVKSIGLIVVKGNYSPDDIKNFYPGSIIPFIDTTNISEIRIKSLAQIDLYNLGFIIFTSWLIAVNSSLNYFKSILLLLFTYGLGQVILRFLMLIIVG